jgi:hypothetical protein
MRSLAPRLSSARVRGLVLASLVAAIGVCPHRASAQVDAPLTGAQALAHPAVQAAIKAAELIKAGKLDEALKLRTKESQAEWTAMSADDRRDLGAGIADRTPDPKALADDVKAAGELSIMGNSAVLGVSTPSRRVAAYFELEAGTWRITNGPIQFATEPDPGSVTRVEGDDLLSHPTWSLALEYLDLVHAGRLDDAKALATTDVQAKWKTEPASEKAESLAFLRKLLPTRAAVTAGVEKGGDLRGVLIVEDDTRGTLNIIQSERRENGPGQISVSSTTTTIPFAKEDGRWRLAQ